MREKVRDGAGEIKRGKEGWLFEDQLIYFTSTGLRGLARVICSRSQQGDERQIQRFPQKAATAVVPNSGSQHKGRSSSN